MRGRWLAVAGFVIAGSASATGPSVSLDAQQLYLFNHAYPGAEIVSDCQGNFTGMSDHEHVLGITQYGKAVRVGLTLDSGKWIFHDIERELHADKLPPRHYPYDWEVMPGDYAPKCKVQPAREALMSENGKLLGDKPLFTLRPGQANTCFATSQQYNNWDCVAWRNGKFRLWYQQVFAD